MRQRVAKVVLLLLLGISPVCAQTPYWTNGVPLATPPLTGIERFPADTYATSGLQQEGIQLGQIHSYVLGTPGTWTALQTFTNSDLALLGSSTGKTTFASANSSATNYTITYPAATGTVALSSTLPVGANPTAQVGLSAVNGSALTFMRSDAAPALASTISAGGPTGSGTVAPIITYNSAGQLTAVSVATITPALGSITGLGTGVGTALGLAVNTTGGVVTQSGVAGWSPTDQSGAGLSFTSFVRYNQVGNIVYIYGTIAWPSTTDTSSVLVGGLPVPVPNQPYAAGAHCALDTNKSLAYTIFLAPAANSSNFALIDEATESTVENITLSSGTIYLSCEYPAN